MSTILEQIFKEKAEASGNIILYSQWDTEKREIVKALNAISILFPHYSLHNDSHSTSIINNITRIIGIDNLKKMSSVDLWLIVEAAYSHDLGMVISAKEITKTLNMTEFIDFFQKIKEDISNPLNQYTKYFTVREKANGLVYNTQEVSLDQHDACKFLLSAYFRENHGDRGEKIIQNHSHNSTSHLCIIDSKNNIPTRLYGILSQICSKHTAKFDEVLSLPFSENGMNIEDAHPIFIACLLRLGDVLDVDNHRFSSPSLMTLSSIPPDTETHIEKHAAITHLRIDRQMVEISANCDNPQVANITKQWFSWIRCEFNNQVNNWNKIVPQPDFGFLPTVNKLEIILKDFIIPEVPAFTIETTKALGLLQGSNIYASWFDSIRELIQNAIDSMLIRCWLVEGKNKKGWSIPDLMEVIKNKYDWVKFDIKIDLKKDDEVNFTIIDNGIGISLEDLKFLSSPGSSKNNTRKRSIVKEMPEEIRPSGIFGIGFQSIFLLTDKVIITTKSYLTDEQHEITMHSPTSKNRGDIYVKQIPLSEKIIPYGAAISFAFKEEVLKEEINLDNIQFIKPYDLLNQNLLEELISMQPNLFFPLFYNHMNLRGNNSRDWIYLPKTKTEIRFDKYHNHKLYFKNIMVSDIHTEDFTENSLIESFTKNIRNYAFNIQRLNADNLLNISRNTIKSNSIYILKDIIHKSVIEYINLHFDKFDENEKFNMSKFVHFYNLESHLIKKYNNIAELYLNAPIKNDGNCTLKNLSYSQDIIANMNTLLDMRNQLSIEMITYDYNDRIGTNILPLETISEYIIKSENHIILEYECFCYKDTDSLEFYMKEILMKRDFYINDSIEDLDSSKFNISEFNRDQVTYTNFKRLIYSTNKISEQFENYHRHIFKFKSIYFLPIIKGFEKLLIDKEFFIDLDYLFNIRNELIISLNVMIIPYIPNQINKNCLNNDFYKYVQNNLKEKNIKLSEIKKLYENLIKLINQRPYNLYPD